MYVLDSSRRTHADSIPPADVSHEEVPQIDYTEALLIDYRW